MALTIEQIRKDAGRMHPLAPEDPYALAYREYVRFFEDRPALSPHDFVIGASVVGAWVPSQMELVGGFAAVAEATHILQGARTQGGITEVGLCDLKGVVRTRRGQSLVAVSKLLHFAAPDRFPMWDRNVVAYLNKGAARGTSYCQRVPRDYIRYLDLCLNLIAHRDFPGVHASVNAKVGYEVTALRALEFVMFTAGADGGGGS